MSAANYWQALPADQQASLRVIAIKWRDLVPTVGTDGSVPDHATAAAVAYWQQLEADVADAYADWLTRTQRKFEANGWPWTTAELARRSPLWEHE